MYYKSLLFLLLFIIYHYYFIYLLFASTSLISKKGQCFENVENEFFCVSKEYIKKFSLNLFAFLTSKPSETISQNLFYFRELEVDHQELERRELCFVESRSF